MEDRLDVGTKRNLCGFRACATRWIAVLLTSLPLIGCQIYSADPISGRVVDKATGEPLEGVVVVAAWIPMGGMEGGNPQGIVQLLEGVTDAKGEYFIPGWGPKPYFGWGMIGLLSPQLLLFKYGFDPEILGELKYLTTRAPSHMTSSRNDQVIELDRARSSLQDYARRVGSIETRVLIPVVEEGGCVWKQIPHLLKAVDEAHNVLKSSGVSNPPLKSLEHLDLDLGCGDVKSFVAERAK